MTPRPYQVAWGWCNENGADFATLDQAIIYSLTVSHAYPNRMHGCWPRIVNMDGYDCDCDQDGYFMCSDGLDDDERERIEMAGL